MKTFSAKSEEVQHNWFLIDAKGKILGRMASEIARRLKGKHKPEYTAHVDTGDCIVVINASEVQISGRKSKDKLYYRHSGHPGGFKEESFESLVARRPDRLIELAVKGMLPKNTILEI
jgi:large subunit ribosomal protein L13